MNLERNNEDVDNPSDTKTKKLSPKMVHEVNMRREKFKMNMTVKTVESFNEQVTHLWTPVSRKVLLPSEKEVEVNPRARSAKLRIATKN